METPSERIQQIINHYFNGNKTKFAEKVGASPQSVNAWLKNAGHIALQRVGKAFPEIDENWLYFGKGEMLPSPIAVNSPNSNNQVTAPNVSIGGGDAINAELRQQIQDLKEQLKKKDEHIDNLLKLLSK